MRQYLIWKQCGSIVASSGRRQSNIGMSAKKVAVIKQFGNAEQGKLTSKQFADSGLRDIKQLFQLARSKFFFLNKLEDVLMQISLKLQFQPLLLAHIKLI